MKYRNGLQKFGITHIWPYSSAPSHRRSSSEELWLSWRRRGTRPEGNWRRSTGSTWQPGTRPLWPSALSTNTTATNLYTTSTITLRTNIVTVNTVTNTQVRKTKWFVWVQACKCEKVKTTSLYSRTRSVCDSVLLNTVDLRCWRCGPKKKKIMIYLLTIIIHKLNSNILCLNFEMSCMSYM